MLYKPGSMFEWDLEWFDYVIVTDQEEADIALADGWVPHKPTVEEAAIAKEPARRGRPPKKDSE
jgi:hypothetical protein